MAQFDVYPNPSNRSRAHFPYLVDVQSPHLADLATRIVIPLGKRSMLGEQSMRGLTPQVDLDDEVFLLLTPQVSSVPAKYLQSPVGSLSHFRDQILAALDFAITGV